MLELDHCALPCAPSRSVDDPTITRILSLRKAGLSYRAACRALGVDPNAATAAALPGLIQPQQTTPRAPQFWDSVFADEMSDSFVRRTLGRGPAQPLGFSGMSAKEWLRTAPSGPLGLSRARRRPSALHALTRFRSTAAAALSLAIVASLAALAVNQATRPAAWASPEIAVWASAAP